MPDFTTAVGAPSNELSLTTSGAVQGGDYLVVSGTGTVAKAGAAAVNWVGIAGHDAASGAVVTCLARGPLFLGVADGSITAGDLLTTGAHTGTPSKTVKSLGAVTTPTAGDVTGTRALVGIALTTAADAAAVRYVAVS